MLALCCENKHWINLQGLGEWEFGELGDAPPLLLPESSPTSWGLPISTGFDIRVAAELFDLLIELRLIDDERPILRQENDFFRDFSFSPLRLSCGLRLALTLILVFFDPMRVPRLLFLRSRLMEVLERSVASSFTCFPPARINETTSTCCKPWTV